MNDLIAAARAKRLAIPADPEFSPEVYENPLAAEVADALAAALSRIEALEAETGKLEADVAWATNLLLEARKHMASVPIVSREQTDEGEELTMQKIDTFLDGDAE